MAGNPYGSEGWSGATGAHAPRRAPKPPSWGDYNREKRGEWREDNPRGGATATTGSDSAWETVPINNRPPSVPGAGYVPPNSGGYYNADSTYGLQAGETGFANTPVADIAYNRDNTLALDVWTQGASLDPTSSFGRYIRAQAPMLDRAYNAAVLSNPHLTRMDFFKNFVGSLQSRYQATPYQLRGENPGAWGQGPSRVIS